MQTFWFSILLALHATPDAPPGSAGLVAAPSTDHQQHRWAIASFMTASLPITVMPSVGDVSSPAAIGPYVNSQISTPAVGLRSWLVHCTDFDVGLDVALGLSTSYEKHGITVSNPSPGTNGSLSGNAFAPNGLYLHVGVPLVLYQSRHYALELIPLLNIGGSWGQAHNAAQEIFTADNTASGNAQQIDSHGFLIEVGVLAGPEITLGYFDLPEVVIQPTVGFTVHYDTTVGSSRIGSENDGSNTAHVDANAVANNPWPFFSGGVNVFYYF